ncbi:MAG: alpha/beta fold hydrolase [Chloroflexi bacterium]|nr:alpha/beta fold hydrolase [Chloroflexota bacterium]
MRRLVFPLFNALCGIVLGALIGYYVSDLLSGVLIGGVVGLGLGGSIEAASGRLGTRHWLYRRRILLTVVLEMPLAVFVCGPFAYVLVETRPDPHPVCCETPLDYGAATYDTVSIRTPDNIVLAGWYVPPPTAPGPMVVLLHGGRGDRRGTAWYARELIAAGYGVLLYDQRAQGESTGDLGTLGWQDGDDLLAVIAYLEARAEVDADRIGVVGLSRGGHIALNAAYLAPDRIAAIWADGVQVQRLADYPPAETAGESFSTFVNGLILNMAELRLGRAVPPAYSQILAELDRPIRLVAGGLDDFERRANQRYAQLGNPNVQVWQIDQAPHVGGAFVIPDEYRQRMLDFFQATLKH